MSSQTCFIFNSRLVAAIPASYFKVHDKLMVKLHLMAQNYICAYKDHRSINRMWELNCFLQTADQDSPIVPGGSGSSILKPWYL